MITENDNKQIDILVTDDNQSMRTFIIGYLRAYFKNQAMSLTEATDGQQAVSQVATLIAQTARSYDLIIMDYEMPILNGQEATVRIRELEKTLAGEYMSKIITWSSAREHPLPGTDIALKKRFSPFEFTACMEALGYRK